MPWGAVDTQATGPTHHARPDVMWGACGGRNDPVGIGVLWGVQADGGTARQHNFKILAAEGFQIA